MSIYKHIDSYLDLDRENPENDQFVAVYEVDQRVEDYAELQATIAAIESAHSTQFGMPISKIQSRMVRGNVDTCVGAIFRVTVIYRFDKGNSQSFGFDSGTIEWACGTNIVLGEGRSTLEPSGIVETDSIARFTPELGIIPSGYTVRGNATIDKGLFTRDILTGHAKITIVSKNGTTYTGGGYATGVINEDKIAIKFAFINPVLT